MKREHKNNIRTWVIYKITSPSGKLYIGKTCNLVNRMSVYKSHSCKSQVMLNRSLNKYGFGNHSVSILDSFQGLAYVADDKEMFWIRSFMSNFNKWRSGNGMNLTDGGDGTPGLKMSEASKLKMSLRKKGKPAHNKGKPMPEHQKEALRKINIGRPSWNKGLKFKGTDEERKIKFGAHNIGNQYNTGRPLHANTIAAAIKKNSVPILYFSCDGIEISKHESIKEASETLNITRNSIAKSLIQKRVYKTKNPYFKYAYK